jgi:hypothetical protein
VGSAQRSTRDESGALAGVRVGGGTGLVGPICWLASLGDE